jgi:hypothetical protein
MRSGFSFPDFLDCLCVATQLASFGLFGHCVGTLQSPCSLRYISSSANICSQARSCAFDVSPGGCDSSEYTRHAKPRLSSLLMRSSESFPAALRARCVATQLASFTFSGHLPGTRQWPCSAWNFCNASNICSHCLEYGCHSNPMLSSLRLRSVSSSPRF